MPSKTTDAESAAESAERLRAILDATVDGIVTIDERGRIESVNAATTRIFGYESEELTGRNVSALMPEPFRSQHDGYLANYRRTGEAKIIGIGREVLGRRKDGSTFPMDLAVGEVKLPGRRMFTGIIRDISAQKQVQAELAEERQRMQFLVENLPSGAVYVDLIAGTTLCNRSVKEITGYDAENLSTVEDCVAVLFPGRETSARAIFADGPPVGEARGRVFAIRRADGAERTVESVRYRYDDHEIWLIRDVTEERAAVETIRRERDFVTALLETTQAVITVIDRGGTIVRCNPAAEHLLGMTAGAMVGRRWSEVFASADGESESPVDRLGRGESVEAELSRAETVNNAILEVIWWGRPLDEEGPSDEFAVLFGQDVTDFRDAQRRALQSERLAAIGQMVTGLAHESRNALQRAQAALDVLSLDVPADGQSLVGRIRAALVDLSRLYEEVRGYAAPIHLETEAVPLSAVWRRAWKALSDAGRALPAFEDGGPDGPVCEIDPYRFEQVFRNLFENAVAVSPPGGSVRVRSSERDGEVRVSVEDDGPGVPTSDRKTVFEPFFTTKQRGTGLGMAIVARIVDAHGGSASIGEAASGGAVVTLTLPTHRTRERHGDCSTTR